MSTTPKLVIKDGKRNRRPTSCEQCRIRKLKCNRDLPCDSCIRRGERSACRYANNANRNIKSKNSNVNERLQRVESLLSRLLEKDDVPSLSRPNIQLPDDIQGSSTAHYTISPDVEIETPAGRPQEGPLETNWVSILEDIKEVREQLSRSDIYNPQDNHDIIDVPEMDLALGPVKMVDFQEILKSVPPRPICDKLLSEYFNAPFMLPLIHTIKFQNEYEKFWQDQFKAPVLWVALLFSLLALTSLLRDAVKFQEAASGQDMVTTKTFRIRTIQCLILGNYTKSRAYTLETLMLHLIGKHLVKPDSSLDGWFLMGIIIRLAMRLGFHRDPKGHPNVSPFDGEIQRRVWNSILQLDVLLSFQMGMPSMIPSACCDTGHPGNYTDSDIYPNIATLPPPRPLTEVTPVLYTIVKGKIMGVFRDVIAHVQSLSSLSAYSVTLELDSKLRKAYAEIPPIYRIEPIGRSFLVTSGVIMCRCSLELLYRKATVVLHRRYFGTEALDPQWEYSRRTCVSAALAILALQEDLHQAASPGGRLHEDRWLLSSLTGHDFLLASMIVCLELSILMRSPNAPAGEITGRLNTLLTSQRIWASRAEHSKEARTAALALQLMIDKAQSNVQSRVADRNIDDIVKTDLLHDVAETGAVSDGLLDHGASELPPVEGMTDIINGSDNLDWAHFDQYFLNDGHPVQPDITDGNWDLFDIGIE